MMLPARTVIAAALIAVPAAPFAAWTVDRTRDRDLRLSLSRVVTSQVNTQIRERCESDPRWFLTGPLEGRPPNGVFVSANPDALDPRPRQTTQGFELYAYDEQFVGSSPAAPRFPNEFRRALQSSAMPVMGTYEEETATGVAMAVHTGWLNGPCAYFMGRMAQVPDRRGDLIRYGLGAFAIVFLAALAASVPLVARVRRLSRLARESSGNDYSTLALDARKDELNVVTFVYNDAATELKQRKARIDDLEAGLRRFVRSTEEEIAEPLRDLAARLADPTTQSGGSTLVDAHAVSSRVENLIAAAKLRMTGGIGAAMPIDMAALVRQVVAAHQPLAAAHGVTIESSLEDAGVTIAGDERLLARAFGNVLDNAIRYNRPGGHVRVTLAGQRSDRPLRLAVVDDGQGVTEEQYRGLTAVRRFRGDEGRNRRPGAPGLGLAVAREVADRFGLSLDLSRPQTGGFEAVFTARPHSAGAGPALDSQSA